MFTNRFLLRKFSQNDLENVYKGLSHPEVVKYYGIRYDSLEATNEQLKWFAELENEGTGIWWAICFQENQEFCGAIGFTNVNKPLHKAEIGFWLLPEYWGKGIVAEVLPLVCNHAFENLGLQRIEAYVETENLACLAVMKKNNFVLEEILKECELKDGKFINLALYALLK